MYNKKYLILDIMHPNVHWTHVKCVRRYLLLVDTLSAWVQRDLEHHRLVSKRRTTNMPRSVEVSWSRSGPCRFVLHHHRFSSLTEHARQKNRSKMTLKELKATTGGSTQQIRKIASFFFYLFIFFLLFIMSKQFNKLHSNHC